MFNPGQITAKQQQEMMRKRLNISTSKQSQLRRIAAQSTDKSLKFWGQKVGKSTMTSSQFKDTLNKLAKEEKSPSLKNVESRVKTFMKDEKKGEQERIVKEQQEKAKQRSVEYRKYLRKREESPDVRKSIREDMARRERERLGTSEKKENSDDTKNEPAIFVTQLSTDKDDDQKQTSTPQMPPPPADLPLD